MLIPITQIVELAKMIGYDPKIVRQLLTKTHTLSDEIEEYFNTNK